MSYPAIYSDKETDIYNYIAQIICKRRADKSKTKLPKFFWRKKYREEFEPWQKIYQSELIKARSLVNNSNFSPTAILKALASYPYALSLHNKHLIDKIVEEQRQVNNQAKIQTELHTTNVNSVPNRKSNKKSKLSKLK